jgi:hypothetical protein
MREIDLWNDSDKELSNAFRQLMNALPWLMGIARPKHPDECDCGCERVHAAAVEWHVDKGLTIIYKHETCPGEIRVEAVPAFMSARLRQTYAWPYPADDPAPEDSSSA